MMTQRLTWYEVWDKDGFGTLSDPNGYTKFDNQRQAKAAIKAAGGNAQDFTLMIVDRICTTDKNGNIISRTTTEARA